MSENLEFLELEKIIDERLSNVTISIDQLTDIPAKEMVVERELMGWCWQSVTVLSVFFGKSDISSKGYLKIGGYDSLFHNWIEINYRGKTYVFDPALNILDPKEDYYRKLSVRLVNQIPTNIYKEALLEQVQLIGPAMYIPGNNDISSPFFRTNSEVIIESDSNMIKSLKAKFLLSDKKRALYNQFKR